MTGIAVASDEPVAIVRLERGRLNAIDPPLLGELRDAVEGVRASRACRAMLLESASDVFFSIGLDLPALVELDRTALAAFVRDLDMLVWELASMPKPTVAAVTGHATAGGCILALACDYRVSADGHVLMGLNEVRLGLPVPFVADCLLRELVGVARSREITDLGRFHEPADSLRLGLVDQVLPLDDLRPAAIARAAELAAMPTAALAAIKSARIDAVRPRLGAELCRRQEQFVACWFSTETQELLHEAARGFRR